MANVTLDAQYIGSSRETRAGRYVMLNVSDTGVGIPPSIREHIFEPFFTTKDVGKGTGFGLATVDTVVKNHGGFLAVESKIGHGSTFKVFLPADLALRAETTPPRLADLPRGHDELVLIIDDEFSIRDITQRTLEAFGYRVIAASNGVEAVDLYSKRPQEIALVLTDMMMPIMDGAATVKAIKLVNLSAKIIVMSGLDISVDFKTSVDAFLSKPFTAQILLRLVREVLDRPVLATS